MDVSIYKKKKEEEGREREGESKNLERDGDPKPKGGKRRGIKKTNSEIDFGR